MSVEVQLAEALRDAKDLQKQLNELQVKHTAALAANEALQPQVDGLQALKDRIAELEPFEAKAKSLETKTRSLEAARAYDRMAEELGVDPKFKDAVYKLAGYESDGDELDEKKLKEHFAKFLEKDGQAFKKATKEPTKFPKGDDATRGARDPGFGEGDAKPSVTRAQLTDPNFTTKHAALLADPASYELVDA